MNAQEALAELRRELLSLGSISPGTADRLNLLLDRLTPDGDLGRILAPKVIAPGNAMPEKVYRTDRQFVSGRGYQSKYDRQIRVYLDRAPKGSKPVVIVEDLSE